MVRLGGAGGRSSSFLSEKSRLPLVVRLARRLRSSEWGDDSQSLELDEDEEDRARPCCALVGGAGPLLLLFLADGRTLAGDLERERDEELDQSLCEFITEHSKIQGRGDTNHERYDIPSTNLRRLFRRNPLLLGRLP